MTTSGFRLAGPKSQALSPARPVVETLSREQSRAGECQQRADVVIVGSLQGGNILPAYVARILQVGTAP